MNDPRENLFNYLMKPSGYMSIIILMITIIATYIITSHFQDKRQITIQESQFNFLSRNNEDNSDFDQHIKVYYDGKEIYDPHVIKITISNTGNQYISESDFISDNIKISLSPNTILYDVSITNATPMGIEEEISSKIAIEDNCLLISPFLFNVDETFTLSIITNQETEVFYSFRIEGISNFKKTSKLFPYIFPFVFCVIFEIILFFMFNRFRTSRDVKYILIICIMIILFITYSVLSSNNLTEMGKNIHQFIF